MTATRSPKKPPAAPLGVNRASTVALYEQIADGLARDIRARKLKPFDKLPSENELVANFGVSRVTVRQAIRKLAEAGLVTSRQGKGVFVAGPVVKQELSALHGFYDSLISEGYQPEASVLSFERVRPSLAAPELRQFEYDIYRFRRLYKIGDMPIAVADVSMPGFGIAVTREDVERHPVYGLVQSIVKRDVARATAQVRAGRAGKDVARLLKLKPASPVLRMDRTSFDSQGLVVESTQFFIQPEVFAFQLEVAGPLKIASSIHRVGR